MLLLLSCSLDYNFTVDLYSGYMEPHQNYIYNINKYYS